MKNQQQYNHNSTQQEGRVFESVIFKPRQQQQS